MTKTEAIQVFNSMGDSAQVRYHPRIGGPDDGNTYVITDIGVVGGRVVAWLRGKSGCVAIEALSKAAGQ